MILPFLRAFSRRRLLALAIALGALPPVQARDAFVLISGGVSPLQNNYSQYLQARAVAQFFEESYPADSVWVFFGAGNAEVKSPVFGDVRRQIKKDGLLLESWLPGNLKRNRPARRAVILKALREEILPAVHDGGTLFLFVGDHGSRTRGKRRESAIDLWAANPDPSSDWGWKYAEHERLSESDLREALSEGLGRGRVVFVMTQCYSGGFHFLGIPREPAPDPAWFVGGVPQWARPARKAAPFPLAAGFTATDHYSIAAGCDPSPDPDTWAGYERFLPEKLLGVDLFSLASRGERRPSFYAAHVEATLADSTVDKPNATSERYLERWATLIENRLAKEKGLSPRVKQALRAYSRAVDTGRLVARDAALKERQALFARYTRRLEQEAPSLKRLLSAGTRAQLADADGSEAAGGLTESKLKALAAARAERRRLWHETLRPKWKEAVLKGAVGELADPRALDFEKLLIAAEEKGRELMFPREEHNALLPYVFAASGAAHPASVDAASVEVIARWAALRRSTIAAWARSAPDADTRAAAAKVFPARRPGPVEDVAETADTIEPDIARERVLFYRRVLAAWAFLLQLDEHAALGQVRRLTALERTRLPAPRRGSG